MTEETAREAHGVAPSPERLPARFAKYTLEKRLARGGMADVFLATLGGAEGFEKELVVKLIRPELSADAAFVERFVEEAKTCVRLAHPNIVSIFELGVEHGVLYMVMELVRGASLGELLHEGGALLPEEGAYVALEVARALDHAHRRGVIHRDVTPGNVMIDVEGTVKLLDFGIAAPVQAGPTREQEQVYGTPGHMPPEQLEGARLSPATDLFALATVIVEAWTGRPPFRRADARASRTAMTEPVPPPSSRAPTLAPLDDVVAAMLSLAPEGRPQHADDVARRVRAWARDQQLDLDEIARGLTKRVTRAMAARDARAAGRVVPPPPMTRSLRPTPLAEGTRTFATREPEGTRRSALEIPPESASTRRLDEPATRPLELAPAPPRRSLVPWALAGLLACGVMVTLFVAGRQAPRPPVLAGSAAASVASGTPTTSASASVAATSASVPSPAAITASAAVSVMPARLVVASSPPAVVELDGRALGTTPISTTATPGDHRVVLRPKGLGESFERRITLVSGSAVEVRGDFNDEPSIVVRKTK